MNSLFYMDIKRLSDTLRIAIVVDTCLNISIDSEEPNRPELLSYSESSQSVRYISTERLSPGVRLRFETL